MTNEDFMVDFYKEVYKCILNRGYAIKNKKEFKNEMGMFVYRHFKDAKYFKK